MKRMYTKEIIIAANPSVVEPKEIGEPEAHRQHAEKHGFVFWDIVPMGSSWGSPWKHNEITRGYFYYVPERMVTHEFRVERIHCIRDAIKEETKFVPKFRKSYWKYTSKNKEKYKRSEYLYALLISNIKRLGHPLRLENFRLYATGKPVRLVRNYVIVRGEKHREGQPISENQRTEREIVKKKYGPHGEGQEHRRIKEWVLKHPEYLGLRDIKYRKSEREFKSGDAADVVFHYGEDNKAVVEVETDNPYPGAYQLIKYRALLCAEEELELDSKKVKAFLIAPKFDKKSVKLCRRYGIETKPIPTELYKGR